MSDLYLIPRPSSSHNTLRHASKSRKHRVTKNAAVTSRQSHVLITPQIVQTQVTCMRPEAMISQRTKHSSRPDHSPRSKNKVKRPESSTSQSTVNARPWNMIHFHATNQHLRKSSRKFGPTVADSDLAETEPANIQIDDYTDEPTVGVGKPVRPASAHVMQRPGTTQKPKRLLSAKPKGNEQNAYCEQ